MWILIAGEPCGSIAIARVDNGCVLRRREHVGVRVSPTRVLRVCVHRAFHSSTMPMGVGIELAGKRSISDGAVSHCYLRDLVQRGRHQPPSMCRPAALNFRIARDADAARPSRR